MTSLLAGGSRPVMCITERTSDDQHLGSTDGTVYVAKISRVRR